VRSRGFVVYQLGTKTKKVVAYVEATYPLRTDEKYHYFFSTFDITSLISIFSLQYWDPRSDYVRTLDVRRLL
jgi:hypothetical protein